MGGKRKQLAGLLFKTRLTNILSRFSSQNKLVVFNYHRLHPDSAPKGTLFDDGVFSASADSFFRQMTWLKLHARILSEQELIEQVANCNHKASNRPSVAITFDDGYQDNYSLAYPILRSLQIPAIFFICTEMIRERKLRWWDLVAYLIKKCRKSSIVIHDRKYALQNNRRKIIEDFQLQMKQYPCEQISNEIRLISEATEIDLPGREIQDRELMTEDQISEVAAHQISIGSHGHTHQALSCLDDCQHEAELMVSKKLLEQMTGHEVKSVSYPFGLHQYIPPSIQDAARKCGYQLGFTSNFGINYLNQINVMALKRFSGELEHVATTSLITVWPELFASREDTF